MIAYFALKFVFFQIAYVSVDAMPNIVCNYAM